MSKKKLESDDIVSLTKDILFTSDGNLLPKDAFGYVIKDVAPDTYLIKFHPKFSPKSNHDVHIDNLKKTGRGKFDYYDKEMFYEWFPVTTVGQKHSREMREAFERTHGEWHPLFSEVGVIDRALWDYQYFIMKRLETVSELLYEGQPVKAYQMLKDMEYHIKTDDFMNQKLPKKEGD